MRAMKYKVALDFIHAATRHMHRDIIAHAGIKQKIFLQDHADLSAQPTWISRSNINAVNQNLA